MEKTMDNIDLPPIEHCELCGKKLARIVTETDEIIDFYNCACLEIESDK